MAERFGSWAMHLFVLAIPATGVWAPASGHDYARVNEVALCLIAAIAWCLGGKRPAASPMCATAVAVAAMLAIASVSRAPDLEMALRELTLLIGLIAVSGIAATQNATAVLATVSAASAFYAALTLVGLCANLFAAAALHPFDLLIGYNNGRFFNHVQTAMLPLLLFASEHPFGLRAYNRLARFGLVVGIALLVVTEGRATGLALTLGFAAAFALFRDAMKPLLRSALVACGVAAAIYLVLFLEVPKLVGVPVEVLHTDGVADTGSAHSRFVLWHIALDGIRSAPWLGIGPMHFSHTWNSDAAHPHNVYLQVAEEWGLPMLVLMLGIALTGLRALYRAVRDHSGDEADRRVGLVLFTTVIAIGIDGMLSGNFVMPVSQVWIAVVFGLAIGWVRRTAPATRRTAPSRAATVLRLVPLVAMSWLAASIAPELGTHLLDRPGPAGTTRDAGAPRFWSNGWF